jgi:hypothetical protein
MWWVIKDTNNVCRNDRFNKVWINENIKNIGFDELIIISDNLENKLGRYKRDRLINIIDQVIKGYLASIEFIWYLKFYYF